MSDKDIDRILAKGSKHEFWTELEKKILKQIDPDRFYFIEQSEGKGGYWHFRGMQEGMKAVINIVNAANRRTIMKDQSPSEK